MWHMESIKKKKLYGQIYCPSPPVYEQVNSFSSAFKMQLNKNSV